MPNIKDFSKLENIKFIQVNPKNWKSLIIEYGISYDYDIPYYYWRIKGTTHTFIISINRLDFISQGDYKKHFEEMLENFREEYLSWAQQNFVTDWMKQYYEQFNNLILL